jgi:hypothetical protein
MDINCKRKRWKAPVRCSIWVLVVGSQQELRPCSKIWIIFSSFSWTLPRIDLQYHLDFKHIMKMTWVHHLFVCVKTEKKNGAIWQNGEEDGSTDTISQTVARNAATTHLASTNAHGTWNGGSFVVSRGIKGNKWSSQIEALTDWSRFLICASGCSLKFILAGLSVVLIEKYHLGQGPFVLGAQGDRPVAPPYGPALDRVS